MNGLDSKGAGRDAPFEWLKEGRPPTGREAGAAYVPPYGDVTALNTCRVILDAVGPDALREIARYAIDLLDTSVAVYEANGDYAFGMFSSGWCQVMDAASRALCGTEDNREALACGKWLCHENCWNDSAKRAMETGESVDIPCVGGIRLYAEPIRAGETVVGAINIGYGDPPGDPARIGALSETFGVRREVLEKARESYASRPPFLLDMAKEQLRAFAGLIGLIVEKTGIQKQLVETRMRERHINRILRAIRNINQIIARETDRRRLARRACRALVETRGYDHAWMVLLDEAGGHDWSEAAGLSGRFNPVREGMERGTWPACARKALSQEGMVLTTDLAAACGVCPLAAQDAGRGSLTVRIAHRDRLYGLLCVSLPERLVADEEEQGLVKEISDDLGLAFFSLEAMEGRKQADETLRRSRDMLARTERIAHVGSWEWKVEEDEVTWSEGLFRIFQRDPAEGTPSWVEHDELYLEEDMKALRRAVEAAVLDGTPYRLELRAVRRDGEIRTCLAQGFAEMGPRGRAVRLFGSLQDITDLRRAEQDLEQARAQLFSVFESLPATINVVDPVNHEIQFMNRYARDLFGRNPEGEKCYRAIHDRSTPCPFCNNEKLLQKGEGVTLRWEYFSETLQRHLMASNLLIRWPDGRLVKLEMSVDVTDRKQAEQALQEHSVQLEQMVEERTRALEAAQQELLRKEKLAALGQLAGGVGHELRNPLGAIKNAAYFLDMVLEAPDEEIRDTLAILNREVAQSERIIQSLFDLADPRHPRPRLGVNLNDAVRGILSALRIPQRIESTFHAAEDPLTLSCDPDQLDAVIRSLLWNAVQAMPEGGRLKVRTGAPEEGWVEMGVSDTGEGIPRDAIDRIFEPLFTTKAKGIGLGLALCRTHVEAHGGTIEVESEEGEGTTFRVRMPVGA